MTTKQETIEYFRKYIVKKYIEEIKNEKEKADVKKDN